MQYVKKSQSKLWWIKKGGIPGGSLTVIHELTNTCNGIKRGLFHVKNFWKLSVVSFCMTNLHLYVYIFCFMVIIIIKHLCTS